MTQLEKMLQPDSQYVFYDDQHGFCINTDDVLMLIEPERKKGEWIPNQENGTFKIYTCSKCGWNSEAEFNFCSNCGSYNGGES